MYKVRGDNAQSIARFPSDKSTLGGIGHAMEIGQAVAVVAVKCSSFIDSIKLAAATGALEIGSAFSREEYS